MKYLLTTVLAAALLTSTANAAETYQLDPAHTGIVWHINHFGFSNYSGKFNKVEGTVTLDQEKPENSKVSVTISVADNATGDPKLNEHIAKPEFFDIEKFPVATFESTAVEPTGADTAKVIGNLTLHGITKPVVLDVKLNKIGENMMKIKTAGFEATTTIKRSDFGMSAFLPNLGDEVRIEIYSETNLVK